MIRRNWYRNMITPKVGGKSDGRILEALMNPLYLNTMYYDEQ